MDAEALRTLFEEVLDEYEVYAECHLHDRSTNPQDYRDLESQIQAWRSRFEAALGAR